MSDIDRLRGLLVELVEVNDAFIRLKAAADAAPLGEESRRWIDRFLLVRKRVESILAAQQVHCLNSLGMPYNSELHRVVEVVPSAQKAGTILEVLADAYAWTDGGRMTALRMGAVRIAGDQARQAGE
jgi:molecular chaperone GrpE (heat shock protein)